MNSLSIKKNIEKKNKTCSRFFWCSIPLLEEKRRRKDDTAAPFFHSGLSCLPQPHCWEILSTPRAELWLTLWVSTNQLLLNLLRILPSYSKEKKKSRPRFLGFYLVSFFLIFACMRQVFQFSHVTDISWCEFYPL